jgi:tetratricopeptide (TPR) repeat protein
LIRNQRQSHRALARAVEVAIAAGDLPPLARLYGKTDLLEALAEAMGLARNALRNLYYRDFARFEIVLYGYIGESPREVSRGLQALPFRQFSPIVWKRPLEQLKASWETLNSTLMLLQAAERSIRESPDAPIELRREAGTVAAEIMACALTFHDGRDRWELLREGERIFLSAMSKVSFDMRVDSEDAALFAKFWENRATICGIEWSNIWDDPSIAPTVSEDVVELALKELDRAADWLLQHGAARHDESARVRQLLADKAKWLAKVGRFEEAHSLLDQAGGGNSLAARCDKLLIQTLELIIGNRLEEALRSAGELAELIRAHDDENAIAPVTSSIMVHNIELMMGRRPPLPPAVETFLRENPVAASEMVNLPRYKQRLAALDYISLGSGIN